MRIKRARFASGRDVGDNSRPVVSGELMSCTERVLLLAAYRPALSHLALCGAHGVPGGALAAYVVTLVEPTGYLLALGLRRRYGKPDPDAMLRAALQSERPYFPILAGALAASSLADLLATLSPNLVELAGVLRRAMATEELPRPLPVLVAAGGGTEIVQITGSPCERAEPRSPEPPIQRFYVPEEPIRGARTRDN
jgi:hypothetical protein